MWGNFCDKDGKPFATVESLVGHYLPLSAGSTNALTGPLYFSPTSALVNKTDAGENVWALFMGDSTNGTSLYIGGFGDYETSLGGNLSNTALLNIDNSGGNYTTRLGYTDENGNIKAGIVTSGDNLSSQTVIHTIGNNDIKHYKNGAEYIIYDSSNLNVEELLQNYTLEGNIIGTPKATRIKVVRSSSVGDDFINNFREILWGPGIYDSWIIPFRNDAESSGIAEAGAASLGWSSEGTHAYLSVSYGSTMRAIIGGGNKGSIYWYKELAYKDDISGLDTVYYPYSGRGHMSIVVDGRPKLDNSYGILFSKAGGEMVEGIYMGSDNRITVGGSTAANVPVEIYNDLGITRIIDRSTKFSLFTFTNGGTEDTQITYIGAEHGTTRIRSGLFNLVHDRGGTLYTVFDSYNFSRDLGSTNLNSSFNHLPMMAAQPVNSDATINRGYPVQNAGSLIVIPGVNNGSSQIYGTYDSNRWFVRSGSPTLNNKNEHTAWKELATTTHLSNYLPLSGGVLSGSNRSVLRINSPSSVPAVDVIFSIGNSIKSGVGFELGTLGAFLSDNVSDKVFCLKNGPEIRTNSGTLIGKIPYKSDLDKYLPLTGGTLTGRLTVPKINTDYIESIDGNALLVYHQDGVTNAQVGIGTVVDQLILRSSNTNLMHHKNGTQYTILDTSNIAALTIKFNGSTNTTYAPNGAKTVNITPSAIGAAPSSHNHSRLSMQDTRDTALYPNNVGTGVLRAIFTNNIMPTSDYWGGIHVHGWSTDYSSWELVGYNGNGDVPTKSLYFRTGILSTWNSWKRVAFSDEIPTSLPASDVYAWAKAPSKPSYSWSEITGKPSTFTPSSHTHPLSDISDLQASWDALLKAAPSAYVTRWPSWSEVTSKPSFATVATSGSYNDLSNRPSIPSAETAATIMSKINSQSEITFTKHVVCSAGAGLQSTSDIRFKSNFNSLPDDTLNKVLNAPEFTYNWKDETTTSIGTSAQYWEDKIPELVHEMEDGTKTFSYERYTVVLQKALKEEHRLREEERKKFKEDINSLNTRLNDLTFLIQKLI